jgi:hypothetical protein
LNHCIASRRDGTIGARDKVVLEDVPIAEDVLLRPDLDQCTKRAAAAMIARSISAPTTGSAQLDRRCLKELMADSGDAPATVMTLMTVMTVPHRAKLIR